MGVWAEEMSAYEYELAAGALLLGFFAFIFCLIFGTMIIDEHTVGGILTILTGGIILLAAMGGLDGLANLIAKIPSFIPWLNIKKGKLEEQIHFL